MAQGFETSDAFLQVVFLLRRLRWAIGIIAFFLLLLWLPSQSAELVLAAGQSTKGNQSFIRAIALTLVFSVVILIYCSHLLAVFPSFGDDRRMAERIRSERNLFALTPLALSIFVWSGVLFKAALVTQSSDLSIFGVGGAWLLFAICIAWLAGCGVLAGLHTIEISIAAKVRTGNAAVSMVRQVLVNLWIPAAIVAMSMTQVSNQLVRGDEFPSNWGPLFVILVPRITGPRNMA